MNIEVDAAPVCAALGGHVLAVEVSEGTLLHAEPEAAVTGTAKAGDNPALQVAQIARFEVNAVERDKAGGGSKPQIAVGGLSDGIDAARRQAILACPSPASVLEYGLSRVQGHAVRGGKAQHESTPEERGPQPKETAIFAHTSLEMSPHRHRRKWLKS
jgi:hypothetical protein